MNSNLEQNMSILMGATTSEKARQLNADIKKKLSDAYFDLFFGLAGANWAHGDKSLGAAWYEALNQIKSMISAKDKSNPAAMYISQIFAAHNTKWSQEVMTNPNREKKLEQSPESRQKWEQDRAKQIGSAMGIINDTLAQYQKGKAAPLAKPTNAQLQGQIQKKILMFMAAQKNIKAA